MHPRLQAVVKAYDVRSETKEQAESLGAQFIVLKSVADASGAHVALLVPSLRGGGAEWTMVVLAGAFAGGRRLVVTG